jgi:hypothetical protein
MIYWWQLIAAVAICTINPIINNDNGGRRDDVVASSLKFEAFHFLVSPKFKTGPHLTPSFDSLFSPTT